ncbi:MAG TPA: NmrA family NAD(P)-binding protein [Vicinamibacterales bacterium]|nr:NmrA family NAD(P)-binding protein [Vicinamibacterales bacterium]
MAESPILVVGATGQLGGVIARKLIASGVPIRALARNRQKLEPLAQAGAEVAAVDMLDLARLTEACRGVGQIIASANNFLGSGPTSPRRVDLTGYQNLCAAARNTGVRRLVYVSFRGATPDAPVDFFRLKWHIEDAIRRSQVPYVSLRPTAFMETWIDEILVAGIRKNGVTRIFGDGTQVSNYIAIDDVAEFAVKILARPDVVKEAVEVGGPSNVSLNDLATLVEKRLGVTPKRRHIPVIAMKVLAPVVKPFNEVTARLMAVGLYSATSSAPFLEWRKAAERFGVSPRSVEDYIATSLKN